MFLVGAHEPENPVSPVGLRSTVPGDRVACLLLYSCAPRDKLELDPQCQPLASLLNCPWGTGAMIWEASMLWSRPSGLEACSAEAQRAALGWPGAALVGWEALLLSALASGRRRQVETL